MTLRGRVAAHVRALSGYHAPAPAAGIKLDANELPFSWSEELRGKFADITQHAALERYPDPRASALRSAVATRTAAREDELVFGSGSDELISLILTTFAHRDGALPPRTLTVAPSFVMYRLAALAQGYDVVASPLADDFRLDVVGIAHQLKTHHVDVLWLASPNNPTGNAFDHAAVREVIDLATVTDTLVVLDEAYGDYAKERLTSFFGAPNVALLGTLSKVGLAGLRVGWARLPEELAQEVEKVRAPFNVSALSQALATCTITEGANELASHVAAVRRERERVKGTLAQFASLDVAPSDANFLLVSVRERHDELLDVLRAQGVAVRSFASHGGRLATSFRVSIGTREENDAFLDAINAWRSV